MNKLDIVVPVKNEEENIKELVLRIDRAMIDANISYCIIFVDDHSTDKTVETIKSISSEYPIKLKIKESKPGKAFSVIEGAELANSDVIAMIDGDLQYPPEKIPEMYWMMNYFGVVVAHRTVHETGLFRKISSKVNYLLFSRLLMGLKCDVQSGLKLLRKEIVTHINPDDITQWTIDLHLILIAQDLGYRIGEVDISFQERKHGQSKINFLSTALEISLSSIKARLKRNRIYSLMPNQHGALLGAGVAYKQKRFITHTDLSLEKSALNTLTTWQKLLIFSLFCLLVIGLVKNILFTAITIIAVISVIYFVDVVFSLYILLKSLHFPPEISYTQEEIDKLRNKDLPVYTILCPLYKEARVLEQFISSISKLDWPKHKLDVLLLLEEDDKETIDKAQSINLPEYVRIFVVPHSLPKTKPKACNFGLVFAKGKYVVIYDAEDRPDKYQLKKAHLAFSNGDDKLYCLQSKLNYYNPNHNLLTKLFTAEYSLWFDIILQGIQSIESTIPLGGTSNHFRTEDLKKLKGWDPFNVTEDCDLGVRIFKEGLKTAIIDSTTYEEANSSLPNWLRQRSRWIKGYFQTYLVHMRDPIGFLRNHGIHALLFQLIIGMRMTFMLINPFLWIATISYFALNSLVGPTIEALYPNSVFYIALFSLLVGNFMYVYNYMIGCAKREKWSLVKYVFLIPFYWLMASIAAFMALYQLLVKPHYWEKTHHGLHLAIKDKVESKFRFQLSVNISVTDSIGRIWDTAVSYFNALISLISDLLHLPKAAYLKIVVSFNGKNGGVSGVKKNSKNKYKVKPQLEYPSLDKLRILILNWRDIKHIWAGGAEENLHQLAKNWVKDGHQVTLFCANDGKNIKEESIDGIRIIRKGGFVTVYIWAAIYYLFKFRGQFDVVIDSENGVPFFTPLYIRKPKFLLVHHINQEVFRQYLRFPLSTIARFIESKLMPFIYQNKKIITISKSSKTDLEQLGFTRPENITVVNPGVDHNKFNSREKTLYPSFLYLGRHKDYKNIDVAIKAFGKVVKKHQNSRLTIAGEGEATDDLQELSRRLGIADKVSFAGKVGEKEKAELFGKSWVALQPSSFEGWGLTVIEANACGTPVIASGVKGLQDSVIHGETGLLAAVKDVNSFVKAMDWIISYPNARKELSKNAQIWATDFKWDVQANEFIRNIQEEIIKTTILTQTVKKPVFQKRRNPLAGVFKLLILFISKLISN